MASHINKIKTKSKSKNLHMFEKFLQLITDPQKMAHIPPPIKALPTGSIFKITIPRIMAKIPTIKEIKNTL